MRKKEGNAKTNRNVPNMGDNFILAVQDHNITMPQTVPRVFHLRISRVFFIKAKGLEAIRVSAVQMIAVYEVCKLKCHPSDQPSLSNSYETRGVARYRILLVRLGKISNGQAEKNIGLLRSCSKQRKVSTR